MSTWTNEKHEAARLLASDYDHPREISFMAGEAPPWAHLAVTLHAALDEVERLCAALDHIEGERSMSKKINAGDTLTVGDLTDAHLGAVIEVGPTDGGITFRFRLDRIECYGTSQVKMLTTEGGAKHADLGERVKVITPPPVVQPSAPTKLGQLVRFEGDDDWLGVVVDLPGVVCRVRDTDGYWWYWDYVLSRAGNRQIIVSDPPRWPDETPVVPESIEVGEWPDDDTHLRGWEWEGGTPQHILRWNKERQRWQCAICGVPFENLRHDTWTRGERVN